jgi:hypothetical protein
LGVSFTELKQVVDGLPVEERLELAQYLRQTSRQDDPFWQAEIERRLNACLQGKGHSADELRALDERLRGEQR